MSNPSDPQCMCIHPDIHRRGPSLNHSLHETKSIRKPRVPKSGESQGRAIDIKPKHPVVITPPLRWTIEQSANVSWKSNSLAKLIKLHWWPTQTCQNSTHSRFVYGLIALWANQPGPSEFVKLFTKHASVLDVLVEFCLGLDKNTEMTRHIKEQQN